MRLWRQYLVLASLILMAAAQGADAQIAFRASSRNGAESEPATDFTKAPIARIWNSKVTIQRVFGYIDQVREEIDLKRSPFMMLAGPAMSGGQIMPNAASSPTTDTRGMLIYLAKKPKPS